MYYYIVIGIGLGLAVIQSLNIITGYAGQPTPGHAAFSGAGAYALFLYTPWFGGALGFGGIPGVPLGKPGLRPA